VSWTQLQKFNEKHVILLGGVHVIYALRCEGFSKSLYKVEYQEDLCWEIGENLEGSDCSLIVEYSAIYR